MTLINEFSLPGVIVISADKRLRDAQRITDDQLKIVRLGRNGVGSICGSPRFLDTNSRKPIFDAYVILAEYFRNRDVTPEGMAHFAQLLVDAFKTFRDSVNRIPPIEPATLMTVVSFAIQETGIVHNCIKLFWSPANEVTSQHTHRLCMDSRIECFGDVDVFGAILKRHPLMAELQERADIQKFIIKRLRCPFGSVTKDEAIRFCREFTLLNSQKMQAIGRPQSVSPDCDIAVVDSNGFRWVRGGPKWTTKSQRIFIVFLVIISAVLLLFIVRARFAGHEMPQNGHADVVSSPTFD